MGASGSLGRVTGQVERILDEDPTARISVIVRMADPDEESRELVAAAAGAVRVRPLALSPRDLLPRSTSQVERTAGRPRGAKARSPEVAGLAAQVPSAAATTPATLRDQGRAALRPLMEVDSVRATLGDDRPRGAQPATPLPVARSAVLHLRRDDLAALPESVPEIREIFPNRVLRLPPVVEVRNLPAAVEDNKASSWGVLAINALAAWGAYGARGAGTKVAVLDTGVDDTHPDLQGKISDWAEFDANGQQVAGSQPHDSDRHGTHVAGTVAGGNASGQWIGVAPDTRIAAGLVLDRGSGTDAQVLAGINWAVTTGADVVSMSLGGLTLGPEIPSTYTAAMVTCLRAGIPVVTAIGNEGEQTSGSPGNDLFAFAVGASDPRDLPAGFSGGRTQVIEQSAFIPPDQLPLPYSKPDVSAPGVAVVSSVPGGQWAAFNGTSMATPHVSGAVALLLSATSIRNQLQAAKRAFLIQDLLVGSVEELGEAGQDHRYGFGRIDVLRAIGFARDRGF
jgi:subtilisin family serine protease